MKWQAPLTRDQLQTLRGWVISHKADLILRARTSQETCPTPGLATYMELSSMRDYELLTQWQNTVHHDGTNAVAEIDWNCVPGHANRTPEEQDERFWRTLRACALMLNHEAFGILEVLDR